MVLDVVIGRNRYHLVTEIEKWCEEHIGNGKWTYSPVDTWEGLEYVTWCVCSMFGRTTFSFKHEHDYEWFTLRWGNDDNDRI